MKTILIPTDYRTASLACIPALLEKFHQEETEVIMVHMLSVTDCVRELLMLSRRSAEYKYIPEDFYATCIKLKVDHFHQLKGIRLEFFYGNTIAALKNFLEANNVDAVLMLNDYQYQRLSPLSIDPVKMIKRCGKAVQTIYSNQLPQKAQPKLRVLPQAGPQFTEQFV